MKQLLASILAVYSLTLNAQEASLIVKVFDSNDDPALFATIRVTQADSLVFEGFSGDSGWVAIHNLTPDSVSVLVTYVESAERIDALLNEGMNLESIYFLQNEIDAVIVEAPSPIGDCIIYPPQCGCDGGWHQGTVMQLHSRLGIMRTIPGMYFPDGSPPTVGRLLNIQPFD